MIYSKNWKIPLKECALFWRMRQELPELVTEAMLQMETLKEGVIPLSLDFILFKK